MTDEQCGYEKSDGVPCKLPASRDDGRCHHHTEIDGERANGGRDFSLGESDHEDILDAARMGASKSGCARAAGVSRKELHRYLDAHANFRTAFTRARAAGEQRLLREPLFTDDHAEREMDGQHARFILSTSFDYSKTEKKELEDVTDGDGGFGTTVVLDSEYVDDE